MAALPAIGVPLDYDAQREQIKDFLLNAKSANVGGPRNGRLMGRGGGENDENDDDDDEYEEDDEDDAALDLYLADNLDLEGRNRRTGLKYKDALVCGSLSVLTCTPPPQAGVENADG